MPLHFSGIPIRKNLHWLPLLRCGRNTSSVRNVLVYHIYFIFSHNIIRKKCLFWGNVWTILCYKIYRCVEDTQSDYVEFSNFNVELKDRKMSRFCGTKEESKKKTVNSDGNFFRVTFKSNDVYDATGFEAFYQFRKYVGKYENVVNVLNIPKQTETNSVKFVRIWIWILLKQNTFFILDPFTSGKRTGTGTGAGGTGSIHHTSAAIYSCLLLSCLIHLLLTSTYPSWHWHISSSLWC